MGEDKKEKKPVFDFNQDLGVFTIKEFDTYQKKNLIEGRLHYLSERVRYYQAEVYTSIGASCIGTIISGIGCLTEENFLSIAGFGVALVGGLFAYGNTKRKKFHEKRLEKDKQRLKILENIESYKTFYDKFHKYTKPR